jgi:hypothetical protein
MREIRIAGMPNSSGGGVAMQAETRAYFQRMTTPPSLAFRQAANRAIYRWKQAGLWPLVKGLWLHCTDTQQAALLSVIGDTPRDAVAVGTMPTFTPLKGFSGFDATHGLKWPMTSAILVSNQCFSFIAGRALAYDSYSEMIIADGAWATGTVTINANNTIGLSGGSNVIAVAPGLFIAGQKYNSLMTAAGYMPLSNTAGAVSNNYRTNPTGGALERAIAYGFLASTATAPQCQKFLGILHGLIDELGAFD